MEPEPTGNRDSTAWRLAQYKSAGQSFKDRVRQRCMQRIKKDRFSAVAERRARSAAAAGPAVAHTAVAAPFAHGFGAPAQGLHGFGTPTQAGFGAAAPAQQTGFGAAFQPAQRFGGPGPAVHSGGFGGATGAASTVAAVLAEEWSAVQGETAGGAEDEAYDHAWMERVYDELQAELMYEEQQIIAQYDAEIGREEEAASMEAMIAEQEQLADAVICPICVKNWLHQNRTVIFCACGFRVDTESDGTTLRTLKRTIDAAVDGHAQGCSATPVFSRDPQLKMMVMRCVQCGHMSIVL